MTTPDFDQDPDAVRKRPALWAAQQGLRVADPDGWRREGSPAFTEPITEAEFQWRLGFSTVEHYPGYWEAIDRAGVELVALLGLDTERLVPAEIRSAAYAVANLVTEPVVGPLLDQIETAAKRERATKLDESEGYERHRLALREALAEHSDTDKTLITHIREDVPQLVDLVRVLRTATGRRHPDDGGMTMGEAVDALRQGERVARRTWLLMGDGTYLLLVPGSHITVEADRPLGQADPTMVGRRVRYAEHIDQVRDGHRVGVWTATGEDILATDWRILHRPAVDAAREVEQEGATGG